MKFTVEDFDRCISDRELELLPFHSGEKEIRSQTNVFAEYANAKLSECTAFLTIENNRLRYELSTLRKAFNRQVFTLDKVIQERDRAEACVEILKHKP